MASLVHRDDKFVTVKKIIFENHAFSVSALCNWYVLIACCLSELIYTFLYATSETRSSNLYRVSIFVFHKLRSSPNPTMKHLTELTSADSDSSISVTIHIQTHVHMNFFLTMTDVITY